MRSNLAQRARSGFATVALLAVAVPTVAQPVGAMVKPEAAGFSSERLERLHALIQDEVDHKQLAGAITILARHGKIVDYRTYGMRDIAAGKAMTKDTIFRDYSMTKPVTGVAMMILYEEGKWLPSDPDREIHSGVRPPEGLQRRRCRRQDDPCRSRTCADDARADVALRGFFLWLWKDAGGCDVPGPEADAVREPSGDD